MGIVNCANEQYGYVNRDPSILRHLGRDWENSVYQMTLRVLKKSDDDKISTGQAANEIADHLSKEEHPLWGHRWWNVQESLLENDWNIHFER